MFKCRNFSGRFYLLTLTAILLTACWGFFLFGNVSMGANRDFAAAADFPRGALVYAQARDLPALLKTWDESEFKTSYLKSENFAQFKNRHLALKIAERVTELDDALGFELDAGAFANASDKSAAVAVYDIGKLEFVFVAALADEKFAATMFVQNQTQFEEIKLGENSVYYSLDTEVDGGRQKQKILFANQKGRFVLATSETLLRRTLANINNQSTKDRLSDEPDFGLLTEKAEFKTAAVWTNQAKLNDDWYFKRYWIGRNLPDLRKFRAGLFTFEMLENKLVENRDFILTTKNEVANQAVSAAEAARLQSFISTDAAYFKIESLTNESGSAAALIGKTLLDRLPQPNAYSRRERWNGYDRYDFSDGSSDYTQDFSLYGADDEIDESDADDFDETEKNQLLRAREEQLETELQTVLTQAEPTAAAFVASPRSAEKPLELDFRRAAVLALQSKANLDQTALENKIAELIQNRLAIGSANLKLTWETKPSKNGAERRELDLPHIGRKICYALINNELIISNNQEMLEKMTGDKSAAIEKRSPSEDFDELAVINLEQRETAFDRVFKNLIRAEHNDLPESATAEKDLNDKLTTDFFAGNINSLLDAANGAKQIEVRKKQTENRLRETIEIHFK